MSDCQCLATYVGAEAWRKQIWSEVFGGLTVPIASPWPRRAEIAGEPTICYLMDLDRISEQQLDHLAAGLAMNFALPWEVVREEMKRGIPIYAADVIITACAGCQAGVA